jgi:hypothetical protein
MKVINLRPQKLSNDIPFKNSGSSEKFLAPHSAIQREITKETVRGSHRRFIVLSLRGRFWERSDFLRCGFRELFDRHLIVSFNGFRDGYHSTEKGLRLHGRSLPIANSEGVDQEF